jgi:plasmid maintenance system antidote protein VapI
MALRELQPESTKERGWLDEATDRYRGDPEHVAEALAIKLTEEALALMATRNMSRADLASSMGVSRAYVTRLFNAPPNLTLRTLSRLALALGVEPEVMLDHRREVGDQSSG